MKLNYTNSFQRDVDAPENISPTFKEEIEKTFESIYNQAVEHCIETVKKFSESHSPNNDPFLLYHNLISELQKLKHQ